MPGMWDRQDRVPESVIPPQDPKDEFAYFLGLPFKPDIVEAALSVPLGVITDLAWTRLLIMPFAAPHDIFHPSWRSLLGSFAGLVRTLLCGS